MKKLVAMLLTFAMLLTLGVNVAFADCSNDTDKGRHPFSGVNLCSTEAKTFSWVVEACYRVKQKNDQRTYVMHHTSRGVSNMTNFFVPTSPYDMSTTYGSKWVTPGTKTPIRSDKTVTGKQYGLKARGNTDHALSGYDTITINGYFNAY